MTTASTDPWETINANLIAAIEKTKFTYKVWQWAYKPLDMLTKQDAKFIGRYCVKSSNSGGDIDVCYFTEEDTGYPIDKPWDYLINISIFLNNDQLSRYASYPDNVDAVAFTAKSFRDTRNAILMEKTDQYYKSGKRYDGTALKLTMNCGITFRNKSNHTWSGYSNAGDDYLWFDLYYIGDGKPINSSI